MNSRIVARTHGVQTLEFEPPIYPFHIDFMRHVSNIAYVQWMEMGRCLLLDAVGMSVAQIAEQGFGPVLVETIVSYKKQLCLGDRVRAEIWLSELSNASAWLEFRFHNGNGDVAATGRQRGLFVDLASGRPRRLTPEDRARFEPFLIT
ncbi:MAG: acyl-CoA thioesterase [Pirellulales bacterium]